MFSRFYLFLLVSLLALVIPCSSSPSRLHRFDVSRSSSSRPSSLSSFASPVLPPGLSLNSDGDCPNYHIGDSVSEQNVWPWALSQSQSTYDSPFNPRFGASATFRPASIYPSNYNYSRTWPFRNRQWVFQDTLFLIGGLSVQAQEVNGTTVETLSLENTGWIGNGTAFFQSTPEVVYSRAYHDSVFIPGVGLLVCGGVTLINGEVYPLTDCWVMDAYGRWSRQNLTAQWSQSAYIQLSYNPIAGQLLLTGGSPGLQFPISSPCAVYSSMDFGQTWTMLWSFAPWGPIIGHAAEFVQTKSGGIHIVVGGLDPNNHHQSFIWTTADGVLWQQNANTPLFSRRAFHSTFVLNGVFYLVGGRGPVSMPGQPPVIAEFNDIYRSFDLGSSWQEVTESSQVPKCHSQNVVVWPRSSSSDADIADIYFMNGIDNTTNLIPIVYNSVVVYNICQQTYVDSSSTILIIALAASIAAILIVVIIVFVQIRRRQNMKTPTAEQEAEKARGNTGQGRRRRQAGMDQQEIDREEGEYAAMEDGESEYESDFDEEFLQEDSFEPGYATENKLRREAYGAL